VSKQSWLYDGRAWLWFGLLCLLAGAVALFRGDVLAAFAQAAWAGTGFVIGGVKHRRHGMG